MTEQTFTELRLDGVSRCYGTHNALEDLSLSIKGTEFVALLGPSGCGKSTALNCVAGLLPLTAGSIHLDDRRIDTVQPEKRGFGMVFQNYALFPHMSVRRNVGFGLKMRKVSKSEAARRVDEAIELVQLTDHAHKMPSQLSGGQQQRVAIARAIALHPPVVLMDEPLSNLDARLRLEMRMEIRRLHQDLGLTTIYVTHDQEEALSMADRVAVMRGGRLEQCAPPAELYGRPATPFVAEFVGTMNRIPGRTADGLVVDVLGHRLPVDGDAAAGSDVDVLVRPEAVRVSADAESDARVIATAFLGAVTRLTVRLPDDTMVKADVATHDAAALGPGATVALTLADRPVLVAARS
jgi:putative spermidine/putrescine transport system ATP-binding protein